MFLWLFSFKVLFCGMMKPMMWKTGYRTIHLLHLHLVVFQLKLPDIYFREHVPGNADTYQKPDVAENHAAEHEGKNWKAQYDKVGNLLNKRPENEKR